MGANPHANGGMLMRDLRMPDFLDYATEVPRRERLASATPMYSGLYFQTARPDRGCMNTEGSTIPADFI